MEVSPHSSIYFSIVILSKQCVRSFLFLFMNIRCHMFHDVMQVVLG